MNMHPLDWVIMTLPVLIVTVVSWVTRKHMKSVADFMSASRCAGRYLICNAAGEAGFGAISAVAIFEYIYKTGFAITWWQKIAARSRIWRCSSAELRMCFMSKP